MLKYYRISLCVNLYLMVCLHFLHHGMSGEGAFQKMQLSWRGHCLLCTNFDVMVFDVIKQAIDSQISMWGSCGRMKAAVSSH